MSQLGVSQCNFIANSLNRLLDLVLSYMLASTNYMLSSPLYRACNYTNQFVTHCEGGVDLIASPMPNVLRLVNKFVLSLRP